MKIEIGFLNIYVTRHRMKKRSVQDDMRRNRRGKMKHLKALIYREQNGCCCGCGKPFPQDAMQIHHRKALGERPDLAVERSNLTLMCPMCHYMLHRDSNKTTHS